MCLNKKHVALWNLWNMAYFTCISITSNTSNVVIIDEKIRDYDMFIKEKEVCMIYGEF